MRKKLVVGNWKMFGSRASNALLLSGLKEEGPWNCDVAVCVPFPYIVETALALTGHHGGAQIAYGAQDCSPHAAGPFTGEVSAEMLADLGCRYAIVGHSERRTHHRESDVLVADKAKAALAHGVTPIVCVGETLAEREAGQTEVVVKRQLAAVIHGLTHCVGEIVLAYEPLWAIGTGRTATPAQAQSVHALLRKQLAAASHKADAIRILYGGSVKPENAAQLFAQPDIDGGLIGGAALNATDFSAICRAAA